MKESKSTETGLICPFCGAPHSDILPLDVAQVKCKYCGGIFPVSSHFKDTAPRCPNHPEVFAMGLCNDCSGNFCIQCLQTYNLKGQSGEAIAKLHLCPECLRKRHLSEANALIFMGILFVIGFGLFWVLLHPAIPAVGHLMILIVLLGSVFLIVFGIYKRGSVLLREYGEND